MGSAAPMLLNHINKAFSHLDPDIEENNQNPFRMEEEKELQRIKDSNEDGIENVEPTSPNNFEMEQKAKEIEQNPDSGDAAIESIDRICEEAKTVSTTSFLVQLFGIHEVVESYENKNLLVSQSFRDLINNVDSGKNICCYFVFQDVRAFVGVGTISRKENEGDQEPYDLGVNWSRLTFLPYSELSNSDTAKSIVSSIEDDENINWEFKSINEEEAVLLENATFLSCQETVDSMRAKYESFTQQQQSVEDEPVAGDHVEEDDESDKKDMEIETTAEQQRTDGTVGAGETKNEDHAGSSTATNNHTASNTTTNTSSTNTKSNRKRTNSGDSSIGKGPSGGGGGSDHFPAEKRSIIPFDVTKMSYEQYCAKHYNYALEMYRQEKMFQFQQQQAAMMSGMMPGMGVILPPSGQQTAASTSAATPVAGTAAVGAALPPPIVPISGGYPGVVGPAAGLPPPSASMMYGQMPAATQVGMMGPAAGMYYGAHTGGAYGSKPN